MDIYKIFNDIYENNEFDETFEIPSSLSIEKKRDLLIKSLAFNHHNTVESIFLYFPKLWHDFSKNDWLYIIEKSLLNIDDLVFDPRLIQSSKFSFLRVLSLFLKVNPFVSLEETNLSTETKHKCYEFGLKFPGLFIKDDGFLERELEDYENINSGLLENIAKKLLLEGMNKLESTDKDFERKLIELQK